MFIKKLDGPRTVRLPNGRLISLADLPPADTRRWVASRKELVVYAVASGMIARSAALKRYSLSEEELSGWETALASRGNEGLKVTKIQNKIQL